MGEMFERGKNTGELNNFGKSGESDDGPQTTDNRKTVVGGPSSVVWTYYLLLGLFYSHSLTF
jgi:hypothetical protein